MASASDCLGIKKKTRSFPAARDQIWLSLTAKVFGVDLGIGLPFFRQVVEREDGGHRTHRHARAAINTFDRINEQHVTAFKLRLVLLGVDAIHRARINTGRVLRAYAGLCNYIRHKAE